MQQIKFRQPLFHTGKKFSEFHYWGFDEHKIFTAPCGNLNDHEKETGSEQFTGIFDKRNNRDVYQHDIYFSEEEEDHGDKRIYFVITWITERCAFVMLEVSEYNQYIQHGVEAIARDFEGFYYEIDEDSPNKMHYAGNVIQNPELLTIKL